uniref:Uncharacterized protein n=1 Tax=Amphimedon queenslandica TaxID=400682 RepID=A0A1X7TKE3_AMPQE
MFPWKSLKSGRFLDATSLDYAQSAILIVLRVSLCLSRALSRPASSILIT